MGGLARRASFFHRLDRLGTPRLTVDAGDLFFKVPTVPPQESAAHAKQADLLGEAMKQFHLDAMGVGELDLTLGVDFLKSLAARDGITLLSSNLVGKDGKPVFETRLVREVHGLKVGLVAAISPKIPLVDPDLKAEDPLTVLRPLVHELRPRVDLLVLLAHETLPEDQALIMALDQVDLIVGGHTTEMFSAPMVQGGGLILRALQLGKYVGQLDLEFFGKGPYKLAAKGTSPSEGIALYANALYGLDASEPDDPDMAALVTKTKGEISHLPGAAVVLAPPP